MSLIPIFTKLKKIVIVPSTPVTPPVSSDWWLAGGVNSINCLVAYQSIGADDYADSKVNLANPGTYNITDGASYPTWNAITGWTFDGIDDYLDTNLPGMDSENTIIVFIDNFNPSTQVTNYIISCTDDDWNAETSIPLNYFDDPIFAFKDAMGFLYNNAGEQEARVRPGADVITPNTPYVFSISLSGSYKNGVKSIWSGFTSVLYNILRNYIIGAIWGGSSYQNFGGMDILAVAIYNTTLTDGQVQAITTALQAL